MKVVISGLGAISALGQNVEEIWDSVITGGSRYTERLEELPTDLRGLTARVDPSIYESVPPRLRAQMDISTQQAVVAAQECLDNSDLQKRLQPAQIGVYSGNSLGGFEFTHREFRKLWESGNPRSVSVYESFAWFYAVTTGQISIKFGLKGPARSLVAGASSGLDALGVAHDAITEGLPGAIAGGADSALDPWGYSGLSSLGDVSHVTDPQKAYLPFCVEAQGYVPGEGGAMLALEGYEAPSRDCVVIKGHARTFNGRSELASEGLARCIRLACERADMPFSKVDAAFMDAWGTLHWDASEHYAVTSTIGPEARMVAPSIGMGRLFSANGPMNAVLAVKSLETGILPGTSITGGELRWPDNFTTLPQEHGSLRNILILGRSPDGYNSALVLGFND